MKNPISLLVDIHDLLDNAFSGEATDLDFYKSTNSGELEFTLSGGEIIKVEVKVPDEKA
jgi:hypothetical protein